ncbi:uncharacterized protein LOC106641920, partial [Copidosoma floridanum]|uniref:uncharacterized protein LOC106641920 n=1 Tax=Copidosoma floridanum TaxID=29053 RepID=UPI0006C961F7
MLTEFRGFASQHGPWIIEERTKNTDSADYEKAIATTGYGLFNILMLVAALPVGWTCVLDTTVTTFFIQSTECDFELTLLRKGIAVGIVYIGMVVAGPLWDFVFQDCVISRLGKRNVIIIGLILDCLCNVLWAHATSFYTFVLFKFLNGILIAGPLSVLVPYLSEFHAPTYQPTFAKWTSLLFVVSSIFPPALASVLILNTSWFNFTVFNRFYETWRVYMLICTIPPALGVFTVCLMPKSPKFLLTQGQPHEALRVFKTMYSMNYFEPSSQFKITTLTSQKNMKRNIKSLCKDKIRDSVLKLKALFSKAHIKTFSIILSLQFISMLGFNTFRLWVPQIFIALNNFRAFIKPFYPEKTTTMCELLTRIKNVDSSCDYVLPEVESAVYVNSIVISSLAVFLSFIFTAISDTELKKVVAIILAFLIATVGSLGLHASMNTPYMLLLCTIIIVSTRTAGNVIQKYNDEVTPQILRSASTNSLNFVGNIGAAVGSIAFSIVLGLNCPTIFTGI